MLVSRNLVPIVVAVLTLACGNGNASGDGNGDPDAPAGESLSAVEAWRSSPDLLLSDVRDLAMDSRGRVYVSDRSAGILLLGARGERLRSVGRKGKGPGEYENPFLLQILAGDSLLIYDRGLRRVTVYPPDSSTAAYSHPISPFGDRMAMTARRVGEDRTYLAAFPTFYSPGAESGSDEPPVTTAAIISPEEIFRDSILVYPSGQPLVIRGEEFVAVRMNPFGRNGVLRVQGGRLYLGWSDSLTISIYDLTGRRVGGFRDPQEEPPVTDADVEHEVSILEESDGPAEMTRQFVAAIQGAVPESWPAFDTFLVDGEGQVWVDLTSQPDIPNEWVVYLASGERIGAFTLPAAFEGMAGGDEMLYGAETDEFDVPAVVAYRVELRGRP